MSAFFRLFLLLMILMLPFASLGQLRKHSRGLNFKYRASTQYKLQEVFGIYGTVGFANYYGDLCDNFTCAQLRPNLGAGLTYRISKKLYSKSELNYVRLASKDVWPDRNLSFRSGNLEVYTSLMYDYYAFTKNLRKRKKYSPYAFAGFGFIQYNPRAKYDGKWYSLRPLKTEGKHYGSIAPIIPVGFGVIIKYTRQWDFLAELGYRITFTDYLDDVSSNKFLPKSSFSNSTAAALSNRTQQGDTFLGYRGNPHRKDGYLVLSFKARYTFTAKQILKNKYIEQHRKIY